MAKGGYVYLVTNYERTVLYTGVTSNLSARSHEHKTGDGSDFTAKYRCKYLVYYEFHVSIEEAIDREKKLKRWRREWKNKLITDFNPSWKDLYNEVGHLR